jgi:RNA polymerase sigma factor (TIGR02999 family)
MSAPAIGAVTELLQEWGRGDEAALEALVPLVYGELHRMAERRMRRERPSHTLQPTALVHEVYLRLVGQKRARFKNRAQFLAIAARAMRRILVDHARRRQAGKRRLSAQVTLDEGAVAAPQDAVDVLALDEALRGLSAIDPRKGQVVELRLFGGLTIAETAEVLGVATSTVINDYRAARAWLRREMGKGG